VRKIDNRAVFEVPDILARILEGRAEPQDRLRRAEPVSSV
jgi:hypothetical protein